MHERAQSAQQTRLAGAVCAGDLQHFAGSDLEVNPGENVALAAPQM
jgi:hypothetical protein